MLAMIWELIQRCGGNLASQRHWVCQLGFAWDVVVRYLLRSYVISRRRATETSWRITIKTLLDVSLETSLRRRGDVPMVYVIVTYSWGVVTTFLNDVTTETYWWLTTETSLSISLESSLRPCGDVPMVHRCYVPLRRFPNVP